MEESLFNELIESIREAGAHLRGEAGSPGDHVHFAGEPDPRAIRNRLGLTQEAFALLLGVPLSTLRNWEQGRRAPSGPALRLLQVAERHPEALLDLVG
jgi:putative transcriptional regulator